MFDTLIVFLTEFFEKKNIEKIIFLPDSKKCMQNYSACIEIRVFQYRKSMLHVIFLFAFISVVTQHM